jgi:hydroxyacylglutathione hydrolase
MVQAGDDPEVRRVVAGNPGPLTGPGTNTWILGRGTVAVIDPGPPGDPAHVAAVLETLDLGERVAAILVTHAHRDHCGAARDLAQRTGAEVLGHPGGAPDRGGKAPADEASADKAPADEAQQGDFAPDRPLSEGEAVRVGQHVVAVLHIPGHHPGHLGFRAGGMLFTGDTVMGWSSTLVAPPEGDMRAYRTSVRRLRDAGARVFLPGHGDPVTDPAGRARALLSHRAARETAVLAALEAGPASLSDLVARVYADTPAALHGAAAGNLLAHLIDLSERGIVAPSSGLAQPGTWTLSPSSSGRGAGSGQAGTVWL